MLNVCIQFAKWYIFCKKKSKDVIGIFPYSVLYKVKEALDKYSIYLFISNLKEDFELRLFQNFQLILSMCFMRYFVNSIIFSASHGLLYCVYIDIDFKKMLEILIFFKRQSRTKKNLVYSHCPC